MSYNQLLSWSSASLDQFLRETHKVADFRIPTAGVESYSVYEWVGSTP